MIRVFSILETDQEIFYFELCDGQFRFGAHISKFLQYKTQICSMLCIIPNTHRAWTGKAVNRETDVVGSLDKKFSVNPKQFHKRHQRDTHFACICARRAYPAIFYFYLSRGDNCPYKLPGCAHNQAANTTHKERGNHETRNPELHHRSTLPRPFARRRPLRTCLPARRFFPLPPSLSQWQAMPPSRRAFSVRPLRASLPFPGSRRPRPASFPERL